jgi:hypothetical protein
MEANPYAAPAAAPGDLPLLNDPEAVRREHIAHEASVRSIGTLYLLGAIGLTGCTLFYAYAMVSGGPLAEESAWSLVGFLAVMTALHFWLGSGLRKLKKPARAVAAILTAIGLIGIPIGTIISAYVLYLLMSRKGNMVFSPEYKQIIEITPNVKYKTSKVVWIVLGVFALVLIAIVVLGIVAAVAQAAKAG